MIRQAHTNMVREATRIDLAVLGTTFQARWLK